MNAKEIYQILQKTEIGKLFKLPGFYSWEKAWACLKVKGNVRSAGMNQGMQLCPQETWNLEQTNTWSLIYAYDSIII